MCFGLLSCLEVIEDFIGEVVSRVERNRANGREELPLNNNNNNNTTTTTTSTTKDKLNFNQVLQKKLKSRLSVFSGS